MTIKNENSSKTNVNIRDINSIATVTPIHETIMITHNSLRVVFLSPSLPVEFQRRGCDAGREWGRGRGGRKLGF